MPRDSDVYLADIIAAIRSIRDYTEGMELVDFADDPKTVDAVVRNLEVIGEAAKRVSGSDRASSPEVEWRKIAGLRDMLAHEYFRVDVEIVWDVVQTKLANLERQVLRLLER